MARKKKFTAAQKKAYFSGMGYRAGKNGKQIPFKNSENKESFRAGYVAAKETVDKYPSVTERGKKK